jgi:hypothetical protein
MRIMSQGVAVDSASPGFFTHARDGWTGLACWNTAVAPPWTDWMGCFFIAGHETQILRLYMINGEGADLAGNQGKDEGFTEISRTCRNISKKIVFYNYLV